MTPEPDSAPVSPELFVARDRARRFHRRIRDALQDRRITYRGSAAGMASLLNDAERLLKMVLDDIDETTSDIDAGRIRDRERGYMEVPFASASQTIRYLTSLALRLDQALTHKAIAAARGQGMAIVAMESALERIDGFVSNYDAKKPIGPSRSTDVAHLLEDVESWHHVEGMAKGRKQNEQALFNRPPPRIDSDPSGLLDLLLQARVNCDPQATTWHVESDAEGGSFLMRLGSVTARQDACPLPRDLARAKDVLSFLHPLEVHCFREPVPQKQGGMLSPNDETVKELPCARVELVFLDETSTEQALSVEDAAGPDGTIREDAEPAVRALLEARSTSLGDTLSPAHLVALMGVFRALDEALKLDVLPRTKRHACRVAASQLPRVDTRKAPVVPAVVKQLEDTFIDFPSSLLEETSKLAADGKLVSRHATPERMAVVLALAGRSWSAGTRYIARAMVMDPLSESDMHHVIEHLASIASAKKTLERGETLEQSARESLERRMIAVLATLGRLPRLG